jgi:hypothetical protein
MARNSAGVMRTSRAMRSISASPQHEIPDPEGPLTQSLNTRHIASKRDRLSSPPDRSVI